jgi:nicotinamide-nucleotide amidase
MARGEVAVLAEEIGRTLRSKKKTLAVAESCTGGKLGDMITEVPGSSDYFLGGIISYSNDSKANLLGVDRETLKAKGAVSEEVALQMAAGARRALGADIGVGVTGVAGPRGGTVTKPVGLVYIAVSSAEASVCKRNLLKGSRSIIKKQSAERALAMLKDLVDKIQ